MAKAFASDAAYRASRSAMQVHGAIGYTWEADLQLWMKKAWALQRAWGDATFHRRARGRLRARKRRESGARVQQVEAVGHACEHAVAERLFGECLPERGQ